MKYLRRHAAADYLKSKYGFGARATLAKLATVGGGPKFRKLGRIPLYTEEWLDDWAEASLGQPMSSTSEIKKI